MYIIRSKEGNPWGTRKSRPEINIPFPRTREGQFTTSSGPPPSPTPTAPGSSRKLTPRQAPGFRVKAAEVGGGGLNPAPGYNHFLTPADPGPHSIRESVPRAGPAAPRGRLGLRAAPRTRRPQARTSLLWLHPPPETPAGP